MDVASKTRTKGHASTFTADAHDKDTYLSSPTNKEIAILGKCLGRDSDPPFTISSQCFGWSHRKNIR
jgi:hypothetical protein